MERERLEQLGGGIGVLVTEAYHFSADALLLASFAAPGRRERVCDLGTGCGIIPLLWCRTEPPERIDALELQPAAALARRSVAYNRLEDRVHIICGDWAQVTDRLPAGSYDRVTCNPPYYPAGSGGVSQTAAARAARHESGASSMEGAARAAAVLLRNGGVFCLCHRPQRLCDLLSVLRHAGMEPKRLRFVQHRADTAPWLVLCEAKKSGRTGVSVLPPLIQWDGGGETGEWRSITASAGETCHDAANRRCSRCREG